MKTVLWVSRHTMSREQFRDLERVMRDTVRLVCHKETVTDVRELEGGIAAADAVAAVLPLRLMHELVKLADDKPVLVCESSRPYIAGDAEDLGKAFGFAHSGWYRIVSLDLRIVPL